MTLFSKRVPSSESSDWRGWPSLLVVMVWMYGRCPRWIFVRSWTGSIPWPIPRMAADHFADRDLEKPRSAIAVWMWWQRAVRSRKISATCSALWVSLWKRAAVAVPGKGSLLMECLVRLGARSRTATTFSYW